MSCGTDYVSNLTKEKCVVAAIKTTLEFQKPQ